jgi:hypothetical protein
VTGARRVLDAIDELYRRAVEDPESIGDDELAGWLADVADVADGAGAAVDRVLVREAAKAARRSRRIARYWSDAGRDPGRLPDWRNGVDEAVGAAAWQPSLAIARRGLETEPDPDIYDTVRELFRTVNFQPWMEGVSYEEYLRGG